MTQPEGLSPSALVWEGNEAAVPNPSLGKQMVEFGARGEGGRGRPTGSVREGWVGLVCLCLFCLVFFKHEIFLQPPVLALSRGRSTRRLYGR